jgi:3,4-dihydroxy 2-butanone 4-phosphate synthase / GTP cyclohydrolase II
MSSDFSNKTSDQACETAIAAFGAGDMVVVTDDDDRENEGDLCVAASTCTAQQMAFIIRHTSGIVCAPLTRAVAERLRLDPMVAHNDAPLSTAFTVSVDARIGTTTGISAQERAITVQRLSKPTATPSDFVRPGHVFPLVARDGGVLMRAGHTEACVDLCVLGGLAPVGVIGELMNDDGTVMRGAEVAAFAQTHELARLSIADLITYRQAREALVIRGATLPIPTRIGVLKGTVYTTPFDPVQHVAAVYGDIADGEAVPVRLHRAHVLQDIFGGAPTINATLDHFAKVGKGVLVYLRDGTAGVPSSNFQQEADSATQRWKEWREVGVGAQILRDLGVRSIHNLTTNPQRAFKGLAGFGIEFLGNVSL